MKLLKRKGGKALRLDAGEMIHVEMPYTILFITAGLRQCDGSGVISDEVRADVVEARVHRIEGEISIQESSGGVWLRTSKRPQQQKAS